MKPVVGLLLSLGAIGAAMLIAKSEQNVVPVDTANNNPELPYQVTPFPNAPAINPVPQELPGGHRTVVV